MEIKKNELTPVRSTFGTPEEREWVKSQGFTEEEMQEFEAFFRPTAEEQQQLDKLSDEHPMGSNGVPQPSPRENLSFEFAMQKYDHMTERQKEMYHFKIFTPQASKKTIDMLMKEPSRPSAKPEDDPFLEYELDNDTETPKIIITQELIQKYLAHDEVSTEQEEALLKKVEKMERDRRFLYSFQVKMLDDMQAEIKIRKKETDGDGLTAWF